MKKLTNLEKYERAYIKALILPTPEIKSRVLGEEIASHQDIKNLADYLEDPDKFYEPEVEES